MLRRGGFSGLALAAALLRWRNTWQVTAWATPSVFGWAVVLVRLERRPSPLNEHEERLVVEAITRLDQADNERRAH